MSTTTIGALIGAGIDSISGDDGNADGAIIGAVTANVLKIVLPVAATYAESNVTATRSTPSSQCAAVKNTRGAINVPEHSSHVPSANACCASNAPTSG